MSVSENVILEYDPLDPNVRTIPTLTAEQERYAKIALGVGVTFVGALAILSIFKESINNWLNPKTVYDTRRRMDALSRERVMKWFDWTMDFVRAVIASLQDYLPRNLMFKTDPVTLMLTREPTRFGYWLERIDRSIDKIMGVAKTFLIARWERAKDLALQRLPRRDNSRGGN